MNYNLDKVTQLFNGLNNYFADEAGTFEEVRNKFINNIKKHGTLTVVKSIVEVVVNTPDGINTEEGYVDTEDAAKCFCLTLLNEWFFDKELDSETREFLKYDERNVWWI